MFKIFYTLLALIPGLLLPVLALAQGPGHMGDGLGDWTMSGMGLMGFLMILIWILLVVLLVLAILALIKYLWKK